MPTYEYRCQQCRRRNAYSVRGFNPPEAPTCAYCGSTNQSRVISRVAIMKSEEARLDALSDPSLVVVTFAVLSTGELAAVAEVVPEVMCTVKDAPEAMSPKEQDRTPAEMLHPELDPPASMDQDRPALVGRVSVTVTLWAVPAPVLDTVIT